MRINERAQIFFYFLSHFLLTISVDKNAVQNACKRKHIIIR